MGFLLHDDRAGSDRIALYQIVDAEPDQIAPAQLLSMARLNNASSRSRMSQPQSNPDGPDLFQLQWRLLTEKLAIVPRLGTSFGLRSGIHEWLLR